MPTPLKPCEGRLTEQVQEAIHRNRNREQWATHLCATCGRTVGVELVGGKWVPERHWPSVAYRPRKSTTQAVRRASLAQLTQDAS